MNRRTTGSLDSLELQLDTVCNVFGSIVLITLLLGLTMSRSSRMLAYQNATTTAQAELIEAQTDREAKERRLAELRKRHHAAAGTASVIASDELLASAERYQQANARRTDLVEAKSKLIGEAAAARVAHNKIDEELSRKEATLDQLRERVTDAQSEAVAVADAKAQVISVPRMALTSLSDMNSYFLVDGKLYGPLFLRDGRRNDAEFKFGDDGNPYVIVPRSDAGLAIGDDAETPANIRDRFSTIIPAATYVRIYAWTTAYHCFEPVRRVLEAAGIKYQLVPCEPRTRVQFSAHDSEPPVVQ